MSDTTTVNDTASLPNEPELPPPTINVKVELAAAYIDDAFHGTRDDLFKRPRVQRVFSNVSHLADIFFLGLMVIPFFERPQWCFFQDTCQHIENLPRSSFKDFTLNRKLTLTLEVILILLLFSITLLHWFAVGSKSFFTPKTKIIYVIFICYFLDLSMTTIEAYKIRFTPYLRPLLFILWYRPITRICFFLIKLLPQVFDVILLIILHISFFSFSATFVARADHITDPGFQTVSESFESFFTALTTANFPDVMIPVYEIDQFWAVIFILFYVIGLFFLTNLLLANIFTALSEFLVDDYREFLRNRRWALKVAFSILSENGNDIPQDTILELVKELNLYQNIPYLRQNHFNTFVQMLCHEESKDPTRITRKEFSKIIQALEMDFDPDHFLRPSEVDTMRVGCIQISHLRKILRHKFYDGVLSFFVCCHICIITIACEKDYIKEDINRWVILEFCFSLCYVLEVALQILCWGVKFYFRTSSHWYDFIVSSGLLIFECRALFFPPQPDNIAVRISLIVRFTRVIRSLVILDQFAVIMETLRELVQPMLHVAGVFLAFLYIFASAGVEIWGGKIYKDNPLLVGTDFESANYYSQNCNDFASCMMVMFDLTIVNNWTIIKSGFCAVSSPYAIWFFIAFYFFGVLIVYNAMVALIIQGFQNESKQVAKEKDRMRGMSNGLNLRRGSTIRKNFGKRRHRGHSRFYEVLSDEDLQLAQREFQLAIDSLNPLVDSPISKLESLSSVPGSVVSAFRKDPSFNTTV